jgi:hypothetical protein
MIEISLFVVCYYVEVVMTYPGINQLLIQINCFLQTFVPSLIGSRRIEVVSTISRCN